MNVAVFHMLTRADREHINIQGALLHVAGDLLGSIAAIIAAGVIYATGWTPIDPLLSLLVAALILRSALSLFRHSLHILLEGAPDNIDVSELRRDLKIHGHGIVDVHHVHVWSLSSGQTLATLHLHLYPDADPRSALTSAKARLADRFGIAHATVQIDPTDQCPDTASHAPKLSRNHLLILPPKTSIVAGVSGGLFVCCLEDRARALPHLQGRA